MPSSLTDSLIRGSPELPNHLNEKKRAINTFPGLPSSICRYTGEKKKKREERKYDNGSFLQKTLDSECTPPASPSKTSLPSPAGDEKPEGFQIC